MTTTQRDPGGELPTVAPDRDDERPPPHPRLLVRLAMVVSIVPLWVSAIRDGRRGWVPTLDVASTVLRARDVISTHPPLVGMWSAGSSWSGHQIHFPGAIQLYLLAVPMHLFGNTWGPLLGMATINSIWILLAGWLLVRRLGPAEALLGIGFLTMLVWSLGSELLVDAMPMNMVVIPFALFLLAVWRVADGDLVALPVLVGVANYLVLSHLVLTFLVPAIGLCAPIGLFLWYRDQRRSSPETAPATRRLLRRQLGISAVITVVLWLPSIVQQLTTSPGNLNLLLASSGNQRTTLGDTGMAVRVVTDMVARPPFWLRGTMEHPSFARSVGPLSVDSGLGAGLVIATLVLAVGLVALAVAAARRHDRTSVSALAVAGVTFVANIVNVRMAPDPWGFPVAYLRTLWPSAMLVWFAVALTLLRLVRAPARRVAVWPIAAATVAFALLALPTADFRSGMGQERVHVARAMKRAVVPAIRSRGLVVLRPGPSLESQAYGAALALELATAGVRFCVTKSASQQYGEHRDCARDADLDVSIVVDEGGWTSPKPGQLVAISTLPLDQQRDLAALRARLTGSLARRQRLSIDPDVRRILEATYSPAKLRSLESRLAPADGDLVSFADDPQVRKIILAGTKKVHGRLRAPFIGTGLSPGALLRWATLEQSPELVVTATSR